MSRFNPLGFIDANVYEEKEGLYLFRFYLLSIFNNNTLYIPAPIGTFCTDHIPFPDKCNMLNKLNIIEAIVVKGELSRTIINKYIFSRIFVKVEEPNSDSEILIGRGCLLVNKVPIIMPLFKYDYNEDEGRLEFKSKVVGINTSSQYEKLLSKLIYTCFTCMYIEVTPLYSTKLCHMLFNPTEGNYDISRLDDPWVLNVLNHLDSLYEG